jgi:hypothetical protein
VRGRAFFIEKNGGEICHFTPNFFWKGKGMNRKVKWAAIMLIIALLAASFSLTGCKKKSEHPSGDHPTGEHPSKEAATQEHPSAEHPTTEHPK